MLCPVLAWLRHGPAPIKRRNFPVGGPADDATTALIVTSDMMQIQAMLMSIGQIPKRAPNDQDKNGLDSVSRILFWECFRAIG